MSFIGQLRDQNSHTRSLAKALTWRFTATVITTIIVFTLTGEVRTAVAVGGVELIFKFIAYYGHERAWQFIR